MLGCASEKNKTNCFQKMHAWNYGLLWLQIKISCDFQLHHAWNLSKPPLQRSSFWHLLQILFNTLTSLFSNASCPPCSRLSSSIWTSTRPSALYGNQYVLSEPQMQDRAPSHLYLICNLFSAANPPIISLSLSQWLRLRVNTMDTTFSLSDDCSWNWL